MFDYKEHCESCHGETFKVRYSESQDVFVFFCNGAESKPVKYKYEPGVVYGLKCRTVLKSQHTPQEVFERLSKADSLNRTWFKKVCRWYALGQK